MSHIYIPKNYISKLNLIDTEIAIKLIKDTFQRRLAESLRLTRVSAPLFLLENTGLNDNLNGVEQPVSFHALEMGQEDIEIIHSLAKWKRYALHRYNFEMHTGLYTDMNAIRKDEAMDNTHSIYVDQWDWEAIIRKEDRHIDYFKNVVSHIYDVLLDVEFTMHRHYPTLSRSFLPDSIYFITSQELENLYPHLTPKQREKAITQEKLAVCIMQIGDLLASGIKHDGRSPDYDDWALNGDILLWNPILEDALEISSMGIRVDEKSLRSQLEKAHALNRISLPYHQSIIDHTLPLTIGGGIGQSRLCMFFLQKAHIGEVQASIWDEHTRKLCEENHIQLL